MVPSVRVLCLFDGSSPDRHPVSFATDLARRLDAELLLAPMSRGGFRRQSQLRPHHAMHTYDLLVVGYDPRGRLGNALSARRFTAMVRDARCPVMLVPPEGSVPARGGIVLGYDASPATDAAATVAGGLAVRLGATLTLVHAFPDASAGTGETGWRLYEAARRATSAAMTAAGSDLHIRFEKRRGPPAEELARAGDDLHAAFVVVASHRARLWRRLVRGSVVQDLPRLTRRPVVVVSPAAVVAEALRAA